MARRYYRRRRYYRKRKIWSSNISKIQSTSQSAQSGNFNNYITLCENPVQSNSSISQKYTVKNIELSYQFEVATASVESLENICVYIMYVPQGMDVTNSLVTYHPEYIMAYRYLGTPNDDGDNYRNPLFIKTRLSRTLNTGDRIMLVLNGYNQSTSYVSYNMFGIVRWWSKAN